MTIASMPFYDGTKIKRLAKFMYFVNADYIMHGTDPSEEYTLFSNMFGWSWFDGHGLNDD